MTNIAVSAPARVRRYLALLRWPVVGLRWRLVLLVVVSLAPAMVLFLQRTATERATLVDEAQARVLRLARAWADNHDATLREANLILEAAMRDPAIREAAPEACGAALRSLATRVLWYSPLAIIDRDGQVQCGTAADRTLWGAPTSDYLDDLFGSHDLEVSEFRRDDNGRSFAFAGLRQMQHGPASAGTRPPDRAAIAAIDLAEIQRRTARAAEGTAFAVTVVGRAGTILACDPAPGCMVGTRIGASHPLMPTLQLQAEGTAEGRSADGIERIFAFTQLPQTGAKLVIALTRADVVGAQEREANNLLIMLAGVAVLAVAAGWLLGELSVVRWVVELGRAAEAFGRGDLERRAALPRSAGEFATLATAFNRMAASMSARRHALEAANLALEMQAEATAAGERRFRDIADIAGDFFWERDPDGRYTFLSERFADVTGVPADWLLGKRPEESAELAADGDDKPLLVSAIAARTLFRNLTLRMTLPNGAVRWWRLSGKPVVAPGTGEFLGFRGSGNDVTAARQAEDDLRRAKEQAETASRAKSDFLATMSHELRTPLNAIIGFSEILGSEMLGPIGAPAYRDYARDILGSGQHLLALISDILDFVKADSGSLQLICDEVDLMHLARGAVRLLETQAEKGGVRLTIEADADAILVWGDERRLRQILLNLLGNAIKFTPADGSVVLRLAQAPDGTTEFAVADTGIGIAAADLPRIMEPFQQVDGGLSRKQEGLGLGLAISDRLVRLHEGSLTIASELGKGTVATVRIPARSPEAQQSAA